jgi:glycerophosphoryl diester phosphodiesterase
VMKRKILAIGHRGAAGITPENTKIAFLKALDLGADAVEFDVQLTRDNVAVVFHDEMLDRTSNGTGRVSETDFDVVSKLDAGGWFGASFENVEIPTLEEILQTLGGKTTMNIELKPDDRLDRLVKHVVTAVARFELFESVIFSSFHHDAIKMIREFVPSARLGVLCQTGGAAFAFSLAERLGAENIHPEVSMVDTDLVSAAHKRGLSVWAWTANAPGEIALMNALGVDGMFSDYPERVVRACR